MQHLFFPLQLLCLLCIITACFLVLSLTKQRASIKHFIAVFNHDHAWDQSFPHDAPNLLEFEDCPLEIQQQKQCSTFSGICELLSPFSNLFRSHLSTTCSIFFVISRLMWAFHITESIIPFLGLCLPLFQTQFFSALYVWNSTSSKSKEGWGNTGLEPVFKLSHYWQEEERNE